MKFTNFKCPICKETSKAGAWNAASLAYCSSHKLKMLSKIQDAGSTNVYSYVCPNCERISVRNRIIPVLNSEKEVNKDVQDRVSSNT